MNLTTAVGHRSGKRKSSPSASRSREKCHLTVFARRTHRERKATYVKSLEVEVAELRNRNAVLAAGEHSFDKACDE